MAWNSQVNYPIKLVSNGPMKTKCCWTPPATHRHGWFMVSCSFLGFGSHGGRALVAPLVTAGTGTWHLRTDSTRSWTLPSETLLRFTTFSIHRCFINSLHISYVWDFMISWFLVMSNLHLGKHKPSNGLVPASILFLKKSFWLWATNATAFKIRQCACQAYYPGLTSFRHDDNDDNNDLW